MSVSTCGSLVCHPSLLSSAACSSAVNGGSSGISTPRSPLHACLLISSHSLRTPRNRLSLSCMNMFS